MKKEKPNMTVEVPGIKIYDPRDGKYKESDNPALIFRFFVTEGYFKMSNEPDDYAISKWADLCDEQINPTWEDQPTEDGFYWLKCKEFKKDQVVEVKTMADEKLTLKYGWQIRFVSSITGKWYGPITGKWYGPITSPIKPPKVE